VNAPYRLQVEEFEGPLDLLLQLVERKQIDITKLALAAVADQYLAYLRGRDQSDLDAWSSFVVIGSRLLQLKSASLLPVPPAEEEEDDGAQLVRLLEEYRRYKEAAEELRLQFQRALRAFPRPAPLAVAPRPPRLTGVTPQALVLALERALAQSRAAPAEEIARRTVTVQERMARLQALLRETARVSFDLLLAECRTRLEIIISFLALLELLKRDAVRAHQDTLFGEILIEAAGT
jgi:segregation and condensation protein A